MVVSMNMMSDGWEWVGDDEPAREGGGSVGGAEPACM